MCVSVAQVQFMFMQSQYILHAADASGRPPPPAEVLAALLALLLADAAPPAPAAVAPPAPAAEDASGELDEHPNAPHANAKASANELPTLAMCKRKPRMRRPFR
jgi:hypothetical protein